MNRRNLLLQSGAVLVGAIALLRYLPAWLQSEATASEAEGDYAVSKTEEEWRKILTPEEFAVLRQDATERRYSSPLYEIKEAGIYSCAGCALPLYSSETKFDSGTGWPSFYASLEDAVATSTDRSMMMVRTEVHCRRCGGHLGHVFDDGPKPTGKRHCINGVALKFTSA